MTLTFFQIKHLSAVRITGCFRTEYKPYSRLRTSAPLLQPDKTIAKARIADIFFFISSPRFRNFDILIIPPYILKFTILLQFFLKDYKL